MEWKAVYRKLRARNWLLLLVLCAGSCLFLEHSFTLGILLGGIIVIANFGLLQRCIRGAFSPAGDMRKSRMSIVGKYYLRLLALGVVIYLLVTRGAVHPVGLALGLSTVVFSIVSLGVQRACKANTGEAV